MDPSGPSGNGDTRSVDDDILTFDDPEPEIEATRGERWFDSWLYARGEPLKKLVAAIIDVLGRYEERKRQRKRRPKDKAAFNATVEGVVTNLVRGLLTPTEAGSAIAVNLSKNETAKPTRYDYRVITKKTLRTVVGLMEEHEFLTRTKGAYRKRATSLCASEWLASLASQKGVTKHDLGWREEQEVIILSSSTRSLEPGRYEAKRSKERIDYRDTEATKAYRAEVMAINHFLEGADIAFIEDQETPAVLPQDRRLKRHFTVGCDGVAKAWQRGGRLFGGFWINLKKHRRGNIRVSGEPVKLLDFSSMFLRLAYAYLKVPPPIDADPYDLTGHLHGYDNSLHREGSKKGFNSLLHGGKAGAADIRSALPKGTKPKQFREAFKARHPALAEYLNGDSDKAMGMFLMFKESQILLRCLQQLTTKGIAALPIHDGILVAESRLLEAQQAMTESAIEHVGYPLPIKVKPPTG
jgi:hypothetical protein